MLENLAVCAHRQHVRPADSARRCTQRSCRDAGVPAAYTAGSQCKLSPDVRDLACARKLAAIRLLNGELQILDLLRRQSMRVVATCEREEQLPGHVLPFHRQFAHGPYSLLEQFRHNHNDSASLSMRNVRRRPECALGRSARLADVETLCCPRGYGMWLRRFYFTVTLAIRTRFSSLKSMSALKPARLRIVL